MKANCIPSWNYRINTFQHLDLQFILFTFHFNISLVTFRAISHSHSHQQLPSAWLQGRSAHSSELLFCHKELFRVQALLSSCSWYVWIALRAFNSNSPQLYLRFPGSSEVTTIRDHFSSSLVRLSICSHLITGQQSISNEVKMTAISYLLIYYTE